MEGYTLRKALEADGYDLVVHPHPNEHPDALGDRDCCVGSMLLTGDRIALWCETWMGAYGAAHELAHGLALRDGKGWQHTEDLWSLQADRLARWVKQLAHERGDF